MKTRAISSERATKLLSALIERESVNPMNRPYERPHPSERPVIEVLEAVFADADVEMCRQLVSERHENLVIEVPGVSDGPGVLLESHMDTVPADDWIETAFTPRVEGDVVYGRGACDDKGPLAAMALAVLEILEAGERPPRPVTLVAASDEEYGQTGIIHYIESLAQDFRFGVFGEPTRNRPVVQHKGVVRWDITTHGKSAHTSQAELGRNAIYDMVEVIQVIRAHEDELQEGHDNPLVTGPRITVSLVRGGSAINIVPESCTASVDYRVVPGLDAGEVRERLIEVLGRLDADVTHSKPQVIMSPLSTAPDDPCVQGLLGICREVLGKPVEAEGAPYGTDASSMMPGVPAVVLGPGDIVYAHVIDEQIAMPELLQGAEIYRRILMTEWPAPGRNR